jgi:signal transduction histidine kinase
MALRNERGEIIGTFGITRDVTDQIMAENALARQAGELSAQNERLRELDRLKDEFVALVSHELRTPHLPVDPARMAQLLGNLISNAVKFTPEAGKVEVTLAVEGNEAVLSASDTGIGIRAADQEQIFERFFRTEAATRRIIPGSGLGLTISKAIVDAHQGAITVRSDQDHGSTFTVRLPLALGSSPGTVLRLPVMRP